MPPRQPTIEDVAASSGLSRGTVSRYLNGGKNVSAPAAEAIEQAIRATGYRVNGVARSLRASRSNTIAFLLPQEVGMLFTDPVHGILARECATALSSAGQQMVLLMAGTKAEQDRAVHYIMSGHVDGVLVVGPGTDEGSPQQRISANGVPVVVCAHCQGEPSGWSTVASDTPVGITEVVNRLRGEGRRRIAFLGSTSALDETSLRLAAYRDALGAEVDDDLVAANRAPTPVAQQVGELAARTQFDALVCVNDVAAAQALPVLAQLGLRVPEDVAVVGFDNVVPICEGTQPTLSSVAQDFSAIAQAMVDELDRLTQGHLPRHVSIATELVRRESW